MELFICRCPSALSPSALKFLVYYVCSRDFLLSTASSSSSWCKYTSRLYIIHLISISPINLSKMSTSPQELHKGPWMICLTYRWLHRPWSHKERCGLDNVSPFLFVVRLYKPWPIWSTKTIQVLPQPSHRLSIALSHLSSATITTSPPPISDRTSLLFIHESTPLCSVHHCLTWYPFSPPPISWLMFPMNRK